VRIIKFSELETVPWKNGGGITREIAALRSGDKIVWRLSMADVTSDGAFSNFAGLTRILTVIAGAGIRLIGEDCVLEANYCMPVEFSGALPIEATLTGGPIRDLNLIFDPNLCHGAVVLANGPIELTLKANSKRTYAVIGLEEHSRLDATQHLSFGDTALIEAGSIELELAKNAAALIVTLNLIG
jgi:uncharacterized protein